MSGLKIRAFSAAIFIMAFMGGCYASSSSHGDVTSDQVADHPQDPAGDRDVYPEWPPDIPIDLPADPPPADIVLDIPADVPPACTPPAGSSVSFTVTGGPAGEPYNFERDCIVAWMGGEDPGGFEIGLNCTAASGESEIYSVAVTPNPGVYIFVPEGTPVTLGYHVEDPWWRNRWFYIRYGGGPLLMAGVDADSLAMPGVDPDAWYEPLIVRPAEGLCRPVPEECGSRERLAIDVTFEGMLARVFDGNDSMVGVLGMYQIIVDEAVVYRDLGCMDFPASWFTALFVSLPVR